MLWGILASVTGDAGSGSELPSGSGGDVQASRILLVDDEPEVLEFYKDALESVNWILETASDGAQALEMIKATRYDLILSDISMPQMDGISLLRRIRETDLDVPVIFVTAAPAVETAMKAIEYGALRYLTKPVQPKALRQVVDYGIVVHRMTKATREALKLVSGAMGMAGDRAGLETTFGRAKEGIVLHYHPIVAYATRAVHGWEVLVRTREPSLARPLELFEAAERLGRAQELGRAIRGAVALTCTQLKQSELMYVNLHPRDLDDPSLYSGQEPLAKFAHRVVLEVSERASLDMIKDARKRIANLREIGYKIAMDDMGAGHAGLATFAQLEPDVVKIDMALVRGSDREPLRRKLIRSISELCGDLKMPVIVEGIETPAERDAVLSAGCDLLQGYLFGRPDAEMLVPKF